MKKYLKEVIILLLQVFTFYLLPQIARKIGAIGMVLTLLRTTFILSIIAGFILKNEIKYFYPIVVSILFIPTIWIYYNESAFIHSLWYLIVSSIGLFIGIIMYKLSNRK